MIVELTRFRVKPGMSHKVDEWLKFLNDNMEGVLLTLEREKMYVETIFREELNLSNQNLDQCTVPSTQDAFYLFHDS